MITNNSMNAFKGQLPRESTIALYRAGETVGRGRLMLLFRTEERTVVVTDQTTFHPCNLAWPDQPGDRGVLEVGGVVARVTDAFVWVLDKDSDRPNPEFTRKARRGDPRFVIVVAHEIDEISSRDNVLSGLDTLERLVAQGAEATLRVDASLRSALSCSHTGCHLMGLSLNMALARFWKKSPPEIDALGQPNFDKLAITKSEIHLWGSTDTYRLGKSLRKAGFDVTAFAQHVERAREEAERIVNAWINANSTEPVSILANSTALDATCRWATRIDGKDVWMFCGGTHPTHIGDVGRIPVEMRANVGLDEMGVTTRRS